MENYSLEFFSEECEPVSCNQCGTDNTQSLSWQYSLQHLT